LSARLTRPKSSTFGFWLSLNATQQKPKELDWQAQREIVKKLK